MLLGDHGLNRDPFIVRQRRDGRALHAGKHLDNLIQLFFRSVQQHVLLALGDLNRLEAE